MLRFAISRFSAGSLLIDLFRPLTLQLTRQIGHPWQRTN
jgi:hypothetical protein